MNDELKTLLPLEYQLLYQNLINDIDWLLEANPKAVKAMYQATFCQMITAKILNENLQNQIQQLQIQTQILELKNQKIMELCHLKSFIKLSED